MNPSQGKVLFFFPLQSSLVPKSPQASNSVPTPLNHKPHIESQLDLFQLRHRYKPPCYQLSRSESHIRAVAPANQRVYRATKQVLARPSVHIVHLFSAALRSVAALSPGRAENPFASLKLSLSCG